MVKIVIRLIGWVAVLAYVLLNVAYFVYLFKYAGFELTAECFFVWGGGLLFWAFITMGVITFFIYPKRVAEFLEKKSRLD